MVLCRRYFYVKSCFFSPCLNYLHILLLITNRNYLTTKSLVQFLWYSFKMIYSAIPFQIEKNKLSTEKVKDVLMKYLKGAFILITYCLIT